MSTLSRGPVRLSFVVLLVAALLASMTAVSAQEASPSASGGSYPVHIHAGSCTDLGEVAYPLESITLAPEEATPVAQPTMMEAVHGEVLSSVTVVDVGLRALIDGDYAINVHAGEDDMGTFIACGDIAGTVRMHRRSDAPVGLVIPLQPLENSAFGGMAWLSPVDGDQTEVTLFLVEGVFGPGPSTQGGR